MRHVKAVFGGVWRGVKRLRELSSGEDLADAQAHRGDDHEFKPNPGTGFIGMGGGGGGGM